MPHGDGKYVVGVLALQGAYAMHSLMLKQLGVSPLKVRSKEELSVCDALIIPGGESTAILHLLKSNDLVAPLVAFTKQKPVLGTCAGAILLSSSVEDGSIEPLGLIDITVKRNATGRQRHSFGALVTIEGQEATAFFIRAPHILYCAPQVKVLATYDDKPILVSQDNRLFAATFHPELTGDETVHRLLIHAIKETTVHV